MKQQRNKEIYIAKNQNTTQVDDYGNEITKYDEPKKYNMNIQPVDGSSDIAMYGNRILGMQKAIVDKSTFNNTFSANDVAYLDGASPTDEKVYGYNANYRIDTVLIRNKTITIFFEKLPTKR